MHILILPSYLYQTPYMPLQGIFQKHQADCLAGAGHTVGVLSAGLLPFKCVLQKNLYAKPILSEENGVAVVRHYGKAYLPQRHMKPEALAIAMVRLGLIAFARYVKERGMPDVLHAHDCLYAGVLALSLKERYALPYVITEHSSAHGRGIYTPEQEKYIRRALGGAAAVTAVGSATAAILKSKYGAGFPAASGVSVLYNLLEAPFEDAALPETSTDQDGAFTFLNVANLIPLKRHGLLVEAFARVLREHPEARLRIGGSGPLASELEKTVTEAGLADSVKLLGRLSRQEVIREMAGCGAFVLCSDIETFGVVLIEAMALGRPVVCTACGGPEDIVDETCGSLVAVGDAEALAGAMAGLIENRYRYDPAEIKRRCVERFGRKAYLERLRRIYETAMNGPGR